MRLNAGFSGRNTHTERRTRQTGGKNKLARTPKLHKTKIPTSGKTFVTDSLLARVCVLLFRTAIDYRLEHAPGVFPAYARRESELYVCCRKAWCDIGGNMIITAHERTRALL